MDAAGSVPSSAGPSLPPADPAAGSRNAIAARRARAAVKQEVASGQRSPLQVFRAAQREGVEAGLRVSEFLGSIPAIGATKRQRVMTELKIAAMKRLGGLGVRQRAALEEWLRERERGRDRRAVRETRETRSRLVVLAGPTAVGKGAVSSYIREHYPEIHLSVSATTRPPRPGEVEGLSYYFVDDAEFDAMVAGGELLEWAVVHNRHRYGTPKAPVRAALEAGRSVLLEIDIQGARQVREAAADARLVFLLPPSWDEMVRRLLGRGTETADEQARRLETAKVELASQNEFDFRVVNDLVARAAGEVVELMQSSGDFPSGTARHTGRARRAHTPSTPVEHT